LDKPTAVAELFKCQGRILDVKSFGCGNVNDTFLVTLDRNGCAPFILQRMNARVFPRPDLVMSNMRTFADHVLKRLENYPLLAGRRWEVPCVLLSSNGKDHWLDSDGSFWRALSYIRDAQSFDKVKDLKHAKEVGEALGILHGLLSDLPAERLNETLEGFHITPRYLAHYDHVLTITQADRSPELDYCLEFVQKRRPFVAILENAKASGELILRPIHGDPKVSNIMLDTFTGQAVSIVDLDTVKPGLIQYDIGDCLRSCCNPLGEDADRWQDVRFEPDYFRAILHGYLGFAKDFLTESDYEYMYDSIRLIAFELGLRFLTDYLEGDVYFKIRHAEQNLSRALVQFRLTESIESQETAIRSIIQDMR